MDDSVCAVSFQLDIYRCDKNLLSKHQNFVSMFTLNVCLFYQPMTMCLFNCDTFVLIRFSPRYIEIFRSTEQLMVKSVMQSNSNRSFGGGGGRNSNNGNFQSNGNNRMHPYDRNGGNNSGRGNNMRGRNQNMRNDFRRGESKRRVSTQPYQCFKTDISCLDRMSQSSIVSCLNQCYSFRSPIRW